MTNSAEGVCKDKLLEGLSGLIGAEGSTYNVAWNDAIRHVIMDVKTGCYTADTEHLNAPAVSPLTRYKERLVEWMVRNSNNDTFFEGLIKAIESGELEK
jgi:hypothetical protein